MERFVEGNVLDNGNVIIHLFDPYCANLFKHKVFWYNKYNFVICSIFIKKKKKSLFTSNSPKSGFQMIPKTFLVFPV